MLSPGQYLDRNHWVDWVIPYRETQVDRRIQGWTKYVLLTTHTAKELLVFSYTLCLHIVPIYVCFIFTIALKSSVISSCFEGSKNFISSTTATGDTTHRWACHKFKIFEKISFHLTNINWFSITPFKETQNFRRIREWGK